MRSVKNRLMTGPDSAHPETERSRSVRSDMIVCAGAALFIATGFSAWVLALYVRRGDGPFGAVGTTPGAAILLYYSAAILIGPLVGLLLPLARASRLGGALVGATAALPLYAMVRIAREGLAPWTTAEIVGVVAAALLVGVPVGLAYRHIFRDL